MKIQVFYAPMLPIFETLTLSTAYDHILVAAFNRPTAANALNQQMALELKDFFTHCSPYRVVLLTGIGKHFCAGADLKERQGMDEAQWHSQHDAFEGALQAILNCPLPVIAAVGGAAMGGGLELALACDFIYAADNALFACTEATLGIMPGLGGTQQLPRAIGQRRAKEFLFSGQHFTAEQAMQWGMVNRVFPPETLLVEAVACAQRIATNAPLSVKAIKRAINQGVSLPLTDALQCELQHYETLLASKDRHEGINAFNEKRKPVFTGE